jgi:hypothetical protein
MTSAATLLLASMSSNQRATASFTMLSDERFNVGVVPAQYYNGGREGVQRKALSNTAKQQLDDLLLTALSTSGLEEVGRRMNEWNGGAQNAYISIFGSPSNDYPWAWRYEGFHASIHLTITPKIGIVQVATTPMWIGIMKLENLNVLGDDEVSFVTQDRAAWDLMGMLSLGTNTLFIDKPYGAEERTHPNAAFQKSKSNTFNSCASGGVRYGDMGALSQIKLMAIVEEFADILSPTLHDDRMRKVWDRGLDDIRFAWAGPQTRSSPSASPKKYFCVQGPTFLLESAMTGKGHVHIAWRDFEGDFGRDILAEHIAWENLEENGI